MRILLVNPSITARPDQLIVGKVPTGLLYVAATLRAAGHDVQVCDCMAGGRIVLSRPDIIGISCNYTVAYNNAARFATEMKTIYPDARIVMGGVHATVDYENILKNPNVDAVIRGDGEYAMIDYVENGKWDDARHEVADLDALPFPARELVNMEWYMNHPMSYIASKRRPTCDIITSRGCPFACTFCSVRGSYRTRSPENVLDEMGVLIKRYGIREFRVIDDNFAYDRERAIAICEGILNRGYDITWDAPNGLALATLDPELLFWMKQGGFYKLILGIESGSPRTLKAMHKPVDLDKARRIIDVANQLGIWTWSTFIIGYPDETAEDIEETMRFIESAGLNMVSIYIAQPLLGTAIYDQYDHSGEHGFTNFFNPTYDTNHFTAAELAGKRNQMFKRFFRGRALRYLNPHRLNTELLTRLHGKEDIAYFIRQLRNFVNKKGW